MATAQNTKVVTGEVRLSFCHLFEPHSNDPAGKPKYSVLLLIPKSDTATIKAIKDAQQGAIANAASRIKMPKVWSDTLHDGDAEKDTDESPEYAGHYFMAVSAQASYPPGLVDAQVNPILDRTELYSGCYGRVSMNAFAYDTAGKKGVSFGLRNVQKLRDGEALGGGVSKPKDDFDVWDSDSDDLL